MHTIKVLAFGSKNFNTSLEELKDYLNFELTTINDGIENIEFAKYDILLVHEDYISNLDQLKKEFLKKIDQLKILATHSLAHSSNIFSDKLSLPIYIKDLKQIIENIMIKKSFNINSSIKIKSYILDKNEKKLTKNNKFILLTEKEIQLLELLLKNSSPLSKNKILEHVWKYSSEADTHTVETHIYRLRKKVKSNFLDEKFILNKKNGYLL
ncbi:winged helix-turn-helix domain-containing protein [Candidatus Pelagibacter bacterium]|nr:winged helix-turn-helix domain-containing protein [Candidatus Pelagibacter bacterium]|tara:strand:- start:308 stop:940 length:633 start_codon:yes stop_codon:yes gene_type:complete